MKPTKITAVFAGVPGIMKIEDAMHMKNSRADEIKAAEMEVLRLTQEQRNAEMSDDRYYTNGSKARDDAKISEARSKLAMLRAENSD